MPEAYYYGEVDAKGKPEEQTLTIFANLP